MSLDKATLKASIKQALLDQRNNTDNPTGSADDLAGKIADAVDTYVKGIGITYTTGLAAPSGGGPVTGTFTYTIS